VPHVRAELCRDRRHVARGQRRPRITPETFSAATMGSRALTPHHRLPHHPVMDRGRFLLTPLGGAIAPFLAEALVHLNVDVIVAHGVRATRAAQKPPRCGRCQL